MIQVTELQAKELRINNETSHGKITFITERTFGVGSEDETQFDNIANDIQPIPLTEEWLVKFGFLKVNGYLANQGDIRYEINDKIESTIYVSFGSNFVGNCDSGFAYVQNVHQLQNLYFALTGIELTIKK